jgi:hypothetical protein
MNELATEGVESSMEPIRLEPSGRPFQTMRTHPECHAPGMNVKRSAAI